MTRRTLFGLRFRVHSPSLWELDACDDLISCVAVALVGRLWYIDVLMAAGHSVHRGPFKSRDDAIEMIANRRVA